MAVIDGMNINGNAYDLRDKVAVRFNEAQGLTEEQKQQGRQNLNAASVSDIEAIDIDERLLHSMIKGTRQVVVYTGGKVTGVNHVDSSNNNHIVRADTFAVDSDPMVEIRTLDTGERLTISTDLTTLTSTITYTPASA